MAVTECWLIDPTPRRLRDALDEAAAVGEEQRPPLIADPDALADLADAAADDAPEGEARALLERANADEPQLVAAWWTDAVGRRHYRVALERNGSTLGAEDPRPALARVYPAVVYRRLRAAGVSEWLAACACGVAGDPAALGWMGPCCGPCHDRRQERPPGPDDPVSPVEMPCLTVLPEVSGSVAALTFSPDGRHLACVDGRRTVRLWDLEAWNDGELYAQPTGEFQSLAFSPDGATLAVLDQRFAEVIFLDLNSGEQSRRWQARQNGRPRPQVSQFCLLAEGAAAAGSSGLFLWPDDGTDSPAPLQCLVDSVWSIAASPNGRSLAAGCLGRIALVNENGRETSALPLEGETPVFLTYLADGSLLALVTSQPDSPHRTFGKLVRYRPGATGPGQVLLDLPVPHILDLSADERVLAAVFLDAENSPATIDLIDLASGAELAQLEWQPDGAIYDLAFSPDGQTLATANADGTVKLWPWRSLLNA